MNAFGKPNIVHKTIEIRLAQTAAEIEAAQQLRYRVFYEDMKAKPTEWMAANRLDADKFDDICDHLIAIDHERMGENGPAVVGCYRLLRHDVAKRHDGFYSAQEYDLANLANHEGGALELGRSCVDADYRRRGVIQLLWRGLAQYLAHHELDLMFGCASFPGVDPDALATELSYLHHFHRAPDDIRPRALDDQYVEMARLPKDDLDAPAASASLPPLIKGYLRLGGFVGDGAVVDHQFNTTDICIIVKTDQVTGKYLRHFSEGGN